MTDTERPWSKVSLQPLDEIPLETLKAWQNDPDIRGRTMGFSFPVQSANIEKWRENKASESGNRSSSSAIFFGKIAVGASFLTSIDWVQRISDFGIYIGDKDAHRKGIGYCACALMLDHAFYGLNLRRVQIRVVETNVPALKLYESLGFVHEGVERQAYLFRGQTLNVLRLGILAEEFIVDIPPSANRFT